jgi:TRIAD3 protein (E3 ubiquitin-protein ligase RNF216)
MSCEEFAGIDKERLVEAKMNEAIVKVCPKCDAHFVKDEGCNKMECPRCNTWICFWCGKVIPKSVGYNHFWRRQTACPPDKCPLWVSNETLNRIQVEDTEERMREVLMRGAGEKVRDDAE